ncbi:MAG: hypothetical protein ACE5I1_04560 [bacterium]
MQSWYFCRAEASAVQRGPVTFVLLYEGACWRINHAHFANY